MEHCKGAAQELKSSTEKALHKHSKEALKRRCISTQIEQPKGTAQGLKRNYYCGVCQDPKNQTPNVPLRMYLSRDKPANYINWMIKKKQ
ncbi:hypothetical protein GJ744_008591 [Endocarpon pusillum]|uniref:Uncharacterized protein n=1 Tax=Endocarpon pusillum TaxID=364733 RepID=A0A8H7AKZ5_9EURO|nr:hypothetical protein GJ744_008591 [Endocarpon pusillum]